MRICILGARILACATMFLTLCCSGCGSESPDESAADKSEPNAVVASVTDNVAVTVNGIDIYESEIEELIRPDLDKLAKKTRQMPAHVIADYTEQFRQHALERLVRERLLDAKIKEADITISDEEVMGQIQQIASAQGVSVDDFIKTLEQYGHTVEGMKQDLRKRLARNRFMQSQWAGKISVSEDEARKYFDENPKQFDVPEQIRASHILIMPEAGGDPNEAKARARTKTEGLLKQIKDGADLAELAKANSNCPSAPSGGDLGFFPRGKATPAFDKVAFELEVGQISDVVETDYGFHIIKATDHKDATTLSFDQARDKIIEQLTSEKQNEFADEYLKKLKAEAKIVFPAKI